MEKEGYGKQVTAVYLAHRASITRSVTFQSAPHHKAEEFRAADTTVLPRFGHIGARRSDLRAHRVGLFRQSNHGRVVQLRLGSVAGLFGGLRRADRSAQAM